MKFVLGYIPGSKSAHWNGPQVYTSLKVTHAGQEYRFERWVRNNGVLTPELSVYNSDDYPDTMIKDMLSQTQIVRIGA